MNLNKSAKSTSTKSISMWKNPENSGVLLVVVSKSGKDEGCSITNVAAHNTYVMINPSPSDTK